MDSIATPSAVRSIADVALARPHRSRHASRPLIELDRVSKLYPTGRRTHLAALQDVAVSLPEGSVTLVKGPSGSGKTTLLGLVGCLVRPTAGRIRVAGRDTNRISEDLLADLRRRCVGFVFQGYNLIEGASALANVMLPALPRAEVDGRLRSDARALLARFGLEHRAHQKAGRLSGGEQQRVAIARALVNDPQIFIADEPTGHLDSESAGRFLDLIRELRSEGKTLLIASHDPVLCESRCFTQVLVLSEGRVM